MLLVSELQAAPALEAVEGKASVAVWRNAVTEQTRKPAGSQASVFSVRVNGNIEH